MSIKKIQITPEPEWKKSLQNYVKTQLAPRILPINETKMAAKQIENIKKMRSIISGARAMEIWIPAFTHESFNPMVNQNFEIYEYLGDKMLSYALGVYMKKKYPNSNEDHLNNFDTYFTSRKPLAEISKQTGMIDQVRSVKKLTEVKEISDIFESVIGAITKIGDDLISPGAGYMIAYNYIASIYNWYDFQKKTGLTSSVNKVMQNYYDDLGWRGKGQKKGGYFENWDKQTGTLTLYLSDKAVKMLRARGTPPKGVFKYQGRMRAVLAQHQGETEKKAQNDLYAKALDVLRTTYKITLEQTKFLKISVYLEKIARETNLLTQKQAKPFYQKIKAKMDRHGYVDLKLGNYKADLGQSSLGTTMFVLRGVKADDIVEIISRAVFKTKSTDNAGFYLYKTFVENDRMKDDLSYYVF